MVKLHATILSKVNRIFEIGQVIKNLTTEGGDLRKELVALCKEAGFGEPKCVRNSDGKLEQQDIEIIMDDNVIKIIKSEHGDYTVLTRRLPKLDGING